MNSKELPQPLASRKKIYFTRHGQGEHNLDDDTTIPDAVLAELGREQCRQLDEASRDTVQAEVELIVVSPLRRTLETMLLSYPRLIDRLEREGKIPVILDIFQEVDDVPSDTPTTPFDWLQTAHSGIYAHMDFKSKISSEFDTKEGIFDPQNVKERPTRCRRWLREQKEDVIAVVAHADILRCIVDRCDAENKSDREWLNCETKVFTFEADDDEDAVMYEIPPKKKIAPEVKSG